MKVQRSHLCGDPWTILTFVTVTLGENSAEVSYRQFCTLRALPLKTGFSFTTTPRLMQQALFCLFCNTHPTCPAHSAQHMLQEIKSFHYSRRLKFGYFRRIKPTYWASLPSPGKDSHCHSRIDIYSTPSLLISIVILNHRGKHTSLSFLLHRM